MHDERDPQAVEKVLNVPAFDYAKLEGIEKSEAADIVPAKQSNQEVGKVARDGSVQRETYAAINEIVQKQEISKTDAFKIYAEQQGKQAGAVAASYYAMARKEAGGKQPASKPGRKPKAESAPTSAAAPRKTASTGSTNGNADFAERLEAMIDRKVEEAVDRRFRSLLANV